MSNIGLEVPLHVGNDFILEYAEKGYNLYAIDGFGYSPLNGGRLNLTFSKGSNDFSYDAHCRKRDDLFEKVTELNENGVPFYLISTNHLCSDAELSDSRVTEVFDFLNSSSVRNGVIVVNPKLEGFVRENYDLAMVSSCIRVFPEKMLSREEKIFQYNQDLKKYDAVVLSQQDSFNREIVEAVDEGLRSKLVPILSSPCLNSCNSYWHYFYNSLCNKRDSFFNSEVEDLEEKINFAEEKFIKFRKVCLKANFLEFSAEDVKDYIELGIKIFKIGRYGDLDNTADMWEFFFNLENF